MRFRCYSQCNTKYEYVLLLIFRYLVIVHPMKAKYISTPGRAKKIITAIWIISLGGASVPAYLARRNVRKYFVAIEFSWYDFCHPM